MSLIKTLIVLTITIALTYGLIKGMETEFVSSYLPSNPILGVPDRIKCALSESNCQQNDLSLQTIIVSLFFMLAGYYNPHSYFIAFSVAIGAQAVRYYLDGNSSFIVDPLANMTAYAIGSILSGNSYDKKYTVTVQSN